MSSDIAKTTNPVLTKFVIPADSAPAGEAIKRVFGASLPKDAFIVGEPVHMCRPLDAGCSIDGTWALFLSLGGKIVQVHIAVEFKERRAVWVASIGGESGYHDCVDVDDRQHHYARIEYDDARVTGPYGWVVCPEVSASVYRTAAHGSCQTLNQAMKEATAILHARGLTSVAM